MISSLAYVVGFLGGVGSLAALARETWLLQPSLAVITLFVSIAILWSGLILEPLEERFIAK